MRCCFPILALGTFGKFPPVQCAVGKQGPPRRALNIEFSRFPNAFGKSWGTQQTLLIFGREGVVMVT